VKFEFLLAEDIHLLFFRGIWPICDRLQTEQQHMPMEESANMFLMLAAVVQRLDTIDFLQPYWNVMETWAQFLNSSLPDPGTQTCPDDYVCDFSRRFQ
jgi:hypothetical protein